MAVTLPEKILLYLDSKDKADSIQLAEEWKEDGQKVVGAIKSLDSLGNVRTSPWDNMFTAIILIF